MIDDLVKALLGKEPRFWGIAITVVIVAASLGPKLMELWDSWRDRRSGRREVEREMRRLKALKLHYEIEVLKQQLPGSGRSPGSSAGPVSVLEQSSVPTLAPAVAKPARAHASAKPWAWLGALHERRPGAAWWALAFLMVIGWALFAFVFFMALFSLIFFISPDKDYSRSDATLTLVVFGIACLPCAFALYRLRAQKRAMTAGEPGAGGASSA
jgi:hypothetical protein